MSKHSRMFKCIYIYLSQNANNYSEFVTCLYYSAPNKRPKQRSLLKTGQKKWNKHQLHKPFIYCITFSGTQIPPGIKITYQKEKQNYGYPFTFRPYREREVASEFEGNRTYWWNLRQRWNLYLKLPENGLKWLNGYVNGVGFVVKDSSQVGKL